jgi:hypothetical protein
VGGEPRTKKDVVSGASAASFFNLLSKDQSRAALRKAD